MATPPDSPRSVNSNSRSDISRLDNSNHSLHTPHNMHSGHSSHDLHIEPPRRIGYSPAYHSASQSSVFFPPASRPLSKTAHNYSQGEFFTHFYCCFYLSHVSGDLSSSRRSLPSYNEATSRQNHSQFHNTGKIN